MIILTTRGCRCVSGDCKRDPIRAKTEAISFDLLERTECSEWRDDDSIAVNPPYWSLSEQDDIPSSLRLSSPLHLWCSDCRGEDGTGYGVQCGGWCEWNPIFRIILWALKYFFEIVGPYRWDSPLEIHRFCFVPHSSLHMLSGVRIHPARGVIVLFLTVTS